jgi:hypothetical protein
LFGSGSSQLISTGSASGTGCGARDDQDTGGNAYQGGQSGQSGYDVSFKGDYIFLEKQSESGDDYKISTDKVSGSGLKYNNR